MRSVLAFLVLATGCIDHGSGDTTVEIRACNASGSNFDAVEYSDFGPEGALPAGTCTQYRVSDHELYRYAFVKITIGGDDFISQPIDFVGEATLPGGRWSYQLTLTGDSVGITAEAD